ncbi:biotin transporter BioY [Thermosediminibacter oceani]|uniref:Biotin transporter n=1 Tax=Thermosediminibacter oceani (strain ATCC BAA-1034 / DSM 16646 / JW/IW-1228P) TaxID=555079 RepID=D9S272_THEOJ|nr:biotin transporter BioY [Thermosediminibacter oceani]ADL07499.1 BioY protein [Thermosediminibacter oceani DSM 16646]
MNKNLDVREIASIALFASITALFGYISIPLPFSPVPITLQTLAVMLAGSVLTPKAAFWSMTVFLFMGAIGLPVFSGGTSGLGILFGPTGGYLMSWPVASYLIALILKKVNPNLATLLLVNILGGIVIVYAVGVSYLAYMTNMTLTAAIMAGALPFIPGDLLKAVVSSVLALSLRKALQWKISSM